MANIAMRQPATFSVSDRCAIRNVLLREWLPHLSGDEFKFLAYLIDNTIEWGRNVLDVTVDQMLDGIRSDNDSGWTWRLPPIGISRRTLERLMASLRGRGAIIVDAVRHKCTRISLNFLWTPVEGLMSLAVPKRLRQQSPSETPELDFGGEAITAKLADNNRQIGGSIKQTDKQAEKKEEALSLRSAPVVPVPRSRTKVPLPTTPEKEKEPSPVAAAPSRVMLFEDQDTVAGAIERVKAKGIETRATKAQKAKKLDAANAYHQTFVAAWRETYPGVPCPVWSPKDMFVTRSVLKARFFDDIPARHDFIDFVVRNWDKITSVKLGWMRQSRPPEKPDIKFATNGTFIGYFLDGFAERKHIEAVNMLPHEQQELARLMGSGMNRDEALIAMGKRQALSQVKANDIEVRRLNGEELRKAEERRKQRIAEQKALLRARSEQNRVEGPQPDLAAELPEWNPEPIDLPPVDLSKWN